MIPSRRRLETALVPGERLERVAYGRLVGEGLRETVAVGVTDRRLVCLGRDGNRLDVAYASISSIRRYTHSRLQFEGIDSRLLAAGFGLGASLCLLAATALVVSTAPVSDELVGPALVFVTVVASLVAIGSVDRVGLSRASNRSRRTTRLGRWIRTGRGADARRWTRRAILGGWIRWQDRTRRLYWLSIRWGSSLRVALRAWTRRRYWDSRATLRSVAYWSRLVIERVSRHVAAGTSAYLARLEFRMGPDERVRGRDRTRLPSPSRPTSRTNDDDRAGTDQLSRNSVLNRVPSYAARTQHAAKTGLRRGGSLARIVGQSCVTGARSIRQLGLDGAQIAAATWRTVKSTGAAVLRSRPAKALHRAIMIGGRGLANWRRWIGPISAAAAVASLATIGHLGGVTVAALTALAVGCLVAAVRTYRGESGPMGIAVTRVREPELTIYTVEGDVIRLILEPGSDVDTELNRLAASVPTTSASEPTDAAGTVDSPASDQFPIDR